MNTTKLLLIFVLIISPFTVSTSIKYANKSISYSYNAPGDNSMHESNKINSSHNDHASDPINNLWTMNCTDASSDHGSEDDAKSHHIHFDRFTDHKRKSLFCIVGKIILILSHLCSLLSIYFH